MSATIKVFLKFKLITYNVAVPVVGTPAARHLSRVFIPLLVFRHFSKKIQNFNSVPERTLSMLRSSFLPNVEHAALIGA